MESLAPFFADFAVDAMVGGEPVRGIFDNGHAMSRLGGFGMAGTQPTLTAPTASLPADPVGQAVQVQGQAYVVAAHEPDGTGVSTLMLERVA